MSSNQPEKLLNDQDLMGPLDPNKSMIPQRTLVSHNSFLAEILPGKGAWLVHFFLPDQGCRIVKPLGLDGRLIDVSPLRTPLDAQVKWWWEDTDSPRAFARMLERCCEEFFATTHSSMEAEYVPELFTWHLTHRGLGGSLDPEGYLRQFLQELDRRLSSSAG